MDPPEYRRRDILKGAALGAALPYDIGLSAFGGDAARSPAKQVEGARLLPPDWIDFGELPWNVFQRLPVHSDVLEGNGSWGSGDPIRMCRYFTRLLWF